MSLTILLTGKNGQVGHDLQHFLPALGKVVALDREEMNLANADQIRQVIQEVRPSIIVNAAAYTAVDLAEKEEILAHAINAKAPAIMAEEAKKIGAFLIHYSTDYVFDGTKHTPYEEDDLTNPINAYGRTKLEGEQAVRNSGVDHLIFRTAWVYSVRGKNFLLTILRLATQRDELRIVNDQVGAPTWSRAIASATATVLSRIHESKDAPNWHNVSGTFHLTAGGQTNWHEFAITILEQAPKQKPGPEWFTAATGGKPILTSQITPIPAVEYPTPARRPAYSVLSNARVQTRFGVQLPDWQTQLRAIFTASAT
jgi:dTDP-4-dehydrorhamnose reductase